MYDVSRQLAGLAEVTSGRDALPVQRREGRDEVMRVLVTAGVERRRILLIESGTEERATLDLALFSTKSATLRVIDNPTGEDNLATVMRRENYLAGVNGGYFDSDDKPVGLLISDGKVVAPLRKARLLSGVMVAWDGRIQLLRIAEYSAKRTATPTPTAWRTCWSRSSRSCARSILSRANSDSQSRESNTSPVRIFGKK